MFIKSSKKSLKGIVITFSAVLEGLFFIGIIALIYWLFLSKYLELHVSMEEFKVERKSILLANALISSEKIVVVEEGKVSRGVFDAEKLDKFFVKSNDLLADIKLLLNQVDMGISYPNSINLVRIVDLEDCNNNVCKGWVGVLYSQSNIEGMSTYKFFNCMIENIKIDIGSFFRHSIGGIILALWQPWDIEKCVKNSLPPGIRYLFSSSKITSEGLPILIRYPNGEFHIGRISVYVGEFL
ncbi:MAG: hypothetical protein QXD89_01085 [Candidatus Aenigmatarchaeota archaeon]